MAPHLTVTVKYHLSSTPRCPLFPADPPQTAHIPQADHSQLTPTELLFCSSLPKFYLRSRDSVTCPGPGAPPLFCWYCSRSRLELPQHTGTHLECLRRVYVCRMEVIFDTVVHTNTKGGFSARQTASHAALLHADRQVSESPSQCHSHNGVTLTAFTQGTFSAACGSDTGRSVIRAGSVYVKTGQRWSPLLRAPFLLPVTCGSDTDRSLAVRHSAWSHFKRLGHTALRTWVITGGSQPTCC